MGAERDNELYLMAAKEMQAFKARFPELDQLEARAIVGGIAATWPGIQADALREAARDIAKSGLLGWALCQVWLERRADDIERRAAEIRAVRSW